MKAVQSFYVYSRECVRVGNDVSEWFPVNVGLRQGCVMSPWLFNVYMNGVVLQQFYYFFNISVSKNFITEQFRTPVCSPRPGVKV